MVPTQGSAPPVRADLLAVAVMVGHRQFARDLLLSFFREELQMLKEASVVGA
jgi:hypothetical protein